jgi:succinoglycan biosynthesis protein ExoA
VTALSRLPEHPSVSVVLPARDAGPRLADAVEAALQPEVGEVVIAVGPSRDGTRELARDLAAAHDRVTVVDNPSGRTAAGLNAAITRAGGQVLVRVDAHAILPEGYVRRALATLRRTGAANVGGRQVPRAADGFAAGVAAAMRSRAGAGGATYRVGGAEGPVDTVYLGAFRREALEAVGGFDPRFVRNQDAELNLRLARAGYTVWYDPELAVAYAPRGNVRSLARQYHGYGRWRRQTSRRHPGSLAPRQLAAPGLVVGLGAASALSLATRDARPALAAWAGYAALVSVAGVLAAGVRDAPRAALALATMHLSWGLGFLQGPPPLDREADDDGRP